MSKEYNVWVVVEEIDQAKEENGKDETIKKLASFRSKKKAYAYANEVE